MGRGFLWRIDRQLSSTDTVQMTLNLAFQMEGRGTISYPAADPDWFEDRCLRTLSAAASNPLFLRSEAWQATVFWSLKELVVGQYEKDRHQFYVQTRPGLLQQWEYGQISRVIDLVSSTLATYGSDSARKWRGMIDMIDAWGACVADGQDYPEFKQELSHIMDADNRLRYDRARYVRLPIPAPLHGLLLRLYDQLATEQSAEGTVVTPLAWVTDAATTEIDTLERGKQIRLTDELVGLQDKVAAIDAQEANCLAITWHLQARLSWFIKLSNHKRLDVVEQHQAWWSALCAGFTSDGDCLEKSDLRTTTEVLLCAAAYGRKSGLSRTLVGLWVLEMNVLSPYYQQKAGSADETAARQATANFLGVNRARLVVGGYIYALAELDSNWNLLETYVEGLLGNVDSRQSLVTVLEGSSTHGLYGRARSVLGLDMAELTRYGPLFEPLLQEIEKLPRSSPGPMSDLWLGHIEHPSAFIQGLGSSPERPRLDDFSEGFLDWLRRRQDTNGPSETDARGGTQ